MKTSWRCGSADGRADDASLSSYVLQLYDSSRVHHEIWHALIDITQSDTDSNQIVTRPASRSATCNELVRRSAIKRCLLVKNVTFQCSTPVL